MKNLVSLVIISIGISQSAFAQSDPADICRIILSDASRDLSISQNSDTSLNLVFDKYCNTSGITRSNSLDIGASVIVEDLPLSFTLGSSDKQTAMSNFCKNYSQTVQSSKQQYSSRSIVLARSLDTFQQCVTISRNGGSISHRVLSNDVVTIDLTAPTGSKRTIQSVDIKGNVECHTNLKTVPRGSSSTETTLTQLSAGSSFDFDGHLQIACHRTPETVTTVTTTSNGSVAIPAGAKIYNEATVSISTHDAGPYGFLWASNILFPLNEANAISIALSSIKDTIIKTNEDLNKSKVDIYAALQSSAPPLPTVNLDHDHPGMPDVINGGCPDGSYVAGLASIHNNDSSSGQFPLFLTGLAFTCKALNIKK